MESIAKWLSYLRQMLVLERGRFVWLIALRVAAGVCDLLLAGAMYVLFLRLQGRQVAFVVPGIPLTAFAAAVLLALRSGFEIYSLRAVVRHVQTLAVEWGQRLARGYAEMDWRRFLERSRSEYLQHAVETSREAAYFYHLCVEMAASVIVVAMMLAALVARSLATAVSLSVLMGVFWLLQRYVLRRRLQEAGASKEHETRELRRLLADVFLAAKELRVYRNQSDFLLRARGHAEAVAESTERLMVYPQMSRTLTDQGAVLAFLLVVAAAAARHGDVGQLLSVLVFYFVLSRRLMPLMSQISFMASEMDGAFVSAQRLRRELLLCEQARMPELVAELPEAGFALMLDGVSLRVGTELVLRDVSLRVRTGEVVVLRGASGSGKSSLLHLMAGIMNAERGTVRVERGEVAYVPQEIVLLDDSIRANVCFGLDGVSDGELRRALYIADLEAFGLDEMVGENGVLFSGGERQRLGIARAVLRAPSLLLLDEATSALDEATAERVLERVCGLGVAVVFASHRDWVGHRVIVVRDGMLVE